MVDFASIGTGLLVAAESSSDSSAFGLVFLLSGFVFYGYVYFRYRNVSQRHRHETETEATKLNVQTIDNKIRELTGLSNSSMQGANNTSVQGGGGGGLSFSMKQLEGLTGSFGSIMGQIQGQPTGTVEAGAVPPPPANMAKPSAATPAPAPPAPASAPTPPAAAPNAVPPVPPPPKGSTPPASPPAPDASSGQPPSGYGQPF